MPYFLDTSILARLANASDVQFAAASTAVLELHRRGEKLHISPQVLIEFRNVATRPRSANGLGLSLPDTETLAATFESRFSLLPEPPDLFAAWKALVGALGIIGKQVHDARLACVCHAHGVTHVLTFNTHHFQRMAGYGLGFVVVDPTAV